MLSEFRDAAVASFKNVPTEVSQDGQEAESKRKKDSISITNHNSFNLFTLVRMPKRLLSVLQRFELRHRNVLLLRAAFVRRRGADLKIRAAVADRGGQLRASETTLVVAATTKT
jgi:hypothetical protein